MAQRHYSRSEAFIVAPLAGFTVFAFFATALGLIGSAPWHAPLDVVYAFSHSLVFGLLIGGPLAYLAELCIGAPVLALLTRLGWAQRAPVVVIAALLGMPAFGLPLALVAGATVADGPPSFLLLIAAGGAIFGGVSGWTFWWMTLRRTEPAP